MTATASTADMLRLKSSAGFTLIEILVTFVIIALGLLGLGAFQLRIQQAGLEAYNRAQALVMLDGIVNRINANRQAAPCYAITTAAGRPYLGYADVNHASAITCAGFGDANTQQLAVNDLNEWDRLLQGAREAVAGNAAGVAFGARGCILFDSATSTYTVAIAWQGMTETQPPTIACGNNAYGTESRRRVVWATFKPATLL
ncbi:MAG: type IV pilus modification protein PilV [Betaproteobacteria bacterium]